MKIKRKKIEMSTAIGLASLLMTIGSAVWIGGFKMSTLSQEVQNLKEDVREIRKDIEVIRTDIKEIRHDLHKMDLRVSALEQRTR